MFENNSTVQPDGCPIIVEAQNQSGKSVPNKLQKSLRQHPSQSNSYIMPKGQELPLKAPTGTPISDCLKAKIRNGPVGKSLGKFAVEHDLVPYPHGNALLGIPEDEKHSRRSYIFIANEAMDHARLHLKKGERPMYVDPSTLRTQSEPPVPIPQHQAAQKHSEVNLTNHSAPAELELTPAGEPTVLRPGKRHPLCENFELSGESVVRTPHLAQNPDDLHLEHPRMSSYQSTTYLPEDKIRSFSRPLTQTAELFIDEYQQPQELLRKSRIDAIARHPTTLRVGTRSQTIHPESDFEQLGESRHKSKLTLNSDRTNLKNFTAPAAVSSDTDSIANIRMRLGRVPSTEELDSVNSRNEIRKKARRHRGTTIVAYDSDRAAANASGNQISIEDIAALKRLGEREITLSADSGYQSGSESPILATTELATTGRAKLTEIKYTAYSRSKALSKLESVDQRSSKYEPYSKSASEQGKHMSASNAWFAAGQTMMPSQTDTRPLPHTHAHPLRSNPVAPILTPPPIPRRSELRPVPTILRHGGHSQRVGNDANAKAMPTPSVSFSSHQEPEKPSRSLKSVRRVTRNLENQGIPFGLQQFQDHDPAAGYRGSDEYRLMRAVRRREAKKVSGVVNPVA